MLVLSALPFATTAFLFWLTCSDVFDYRAGRVPANWSFRLALPVLVGVFSPLAAAASPDARMGTALLVYVAAGVAFTIVVGARFGSAQSYVSLNVPFGRGPRRLAELPWWNVVRAVGLVIILSGAVVNILSAN